MLVVCWGVCVRCWSDGDRDIIVKEVTVEGSGVMVV